MTPKTYTYFDSNTEIPGISLAGIPVGSLITVDVDTYPYTILNVMTVNGSVIYSGGNSTVVTTPSITSPVYLNARDFGAIGTDTASDTTAIAAGLSALAAMGGGTLYIPAGTYYFASTLHITSDNVHLCGSGLGTKIIAATGFTNAPLIQVDAPTTPGTFRRGIKITDMYISGASQTNVGGIQLTSTYSALIDHVWVQYCQGIGINLTGSSSAYGAYSVIRASTVSDGYTGTAIATSYHESNVIESSVISWHNGSTGIGVYSTDSDLWVSNCVFDECNTGVWLFFCHNNCISNNQFDRGVTHFLYLNGAYNSRILGNTFSAFVGTGAKSVIDVDNSSNQGNLITNNIFEPNEGWTYAITEAGGTGTPGNRYVNNHISTYGVQLVSGKALQNSGYITESHGTATIAANASSVTVSHGLSTTPMLEQISVTPQSSLGSASTFWVTNATSTQFTINVNANPGTSVSFGWRVNAGS